MDGWREGGSPAGLAGPGARAGRQSKRCCVFRAPLWVGPGRPHAVAGRARASHAASVRRSHGVRGGADQGNGTFRWKTAPTAHPAPPGAWAGGPGLLASRNLDPARENPTGSKTKARPSAARHSESSVCGGLGVSDPKGSGIRAGRFRVGPARDQGRQTMGTPRQRGQFQPTPARAKGDFSPPWRRAPPPRRQPRRRRHGGLIGRRAPRARSPAAAPPPLPPEVRPPATTAAGRGGGAQPQPLAVAGGRGGGEVRPATVRRAAGGLRAAGRPVASPQSRRPRLSPRPADRFVTMAGSGRTPAAGGCGGGCARAARHGSGGRCAVRPGQRPGGMGGPSRKGPKGSRYRGRGGGASRARGGRAGGPNAIGSKMKSCAAAAAAAASGGGRAGCVCAGAH
jgi:hypothetical protein